MHVRAEFQINEAIGYFGQGWPLTIIHYLQEKCLSIFPCARSSENRPLNMAPSAVSDVYFELALNPCV